MANTSDFRNGLCIEHNNDIYQIVEFQHVKPGKGGAFVRTKLKSLNTGRVIDNTFNAGVKIVTARIDRKSYQFLYKDDNGYCFMDNETFEQVTLQEEMVSNSGLMKEGQEVEIMSHEETGKTFSCELPSFVELEIKETVPGVKGDTAASSLKPATVETGMSINVPLFVNAGDKIKVDTRTNSYVERVK